MDVITRRLIALGNRIAAELRRLSDVTQQQVNTERDARQAQEEQNAPPPLVAISQPIEIKKSTADAQQDGKQHSHMFWLQFALTAFTAAAFGAAARYACTAKQQLDTMNKTYGEMQNQTKQLTIQAGEIAKQTGLLQDQLEATEGPDLTPSVQGVWTDGRFSVEIYAAPNRPKARDVKLDITFTYLDAVSGKPIQPSITKSQTWPTMESDPMNRPHYQPEVFQPGSTVWQRFANGDLILRAVGKLSWPTGFGKIRSYPICYMDFALTDPTEPHGNTFQHKGPSQCILGGSYREDFSNAVQAIDRERAFLKSQQQKR